MLCKVCSKFISDDSLFCNFCGAKQLLSDETIEDVSNYITYTPVAIQKTYKQLMSLLKKNEIYGSLLKIKDVFEISLKYPLVILASYLEQKCEMNGEKGFLEEYSKLNVQFRCMIFDIINYKLSMGNWETIAQEISKIEEKNFLDTQYKSIIKVILDINKNNAQKYNNYIDENNNKIRISTWRNNTIGHGALNCKDIMLVKKDVLNKLKYLNVILKENDDLYKKLLFKNDEKKNIISDGEEEFCVYPFIENINNIEIKSNIFDSYDKNRKKACVINYNDGIKKKNNELSKKIKNMDRNIKYSKMISFFNTQGDNKLGSDTVMTAEVEMIKAFDNKSMRGGQYFSEWFINCIENHDRGVFVCTAESGMGKSAFSHAVDQLDPMKVEKNNELKKYVSKTEYIIRTYSFNSYYYSKEYVFIEKIIEKFCQELYYDDYNRVMIKSVVDISRKIWDCRDALRRALNKGKNKYQVLFLELLKSLKETLGKQKIILVLDGIDEIFNSDNSFELKNWLPDFLQFTKEEYKNIYIFVFMRKSLRYKNILVEDKYTTSYLDMKRENDEYQTAYKEYIKNIIKIENDSACLNLALKLEWKYNYLLAYERIKFIDDEHKEYKSQCIFAMLLNNLKRFSNQYSNEVKELLILLASINNGITINEINYLLRNEREPDFKIYGLLTDIINFLDIERDIELGNLFRLNHYDWRKEILTNFEKSALLNKISILLNEELNEENRSFENIVAIIAVNGLLENLDEEKIQIVIREIRKKINKCHKMRDLLIILNSFSDLETYIRQKENKKYMYLLPKILATQGDIYVKIGIFEEALNAYEEAMDFQFELINNTKESIIKHNQLIFYCILCAKKGELLSEYGSINSSIKYYSKAISLVSKNDLNEITLVLLECFYKKRAYLLNVNDKYLESRKDYKKALEISLLLDPGITIEKKIIYFNDDEILSRGFIYQNLGELNKALDCYHRSLFLKLVKYRRRKIDIEELIDVYYLISSTFIELNNYKKSLKYSKVIIKKIKENKVDFEWKYYKNYTLALRKTGESNYIEIYNEIINKLQYLKDKSFSNGAFFNIIILIDAYSSIGCALYENKKIDEAELQFQKIYKLINETLKKKRMNKHEEIIRLAYDTYKNIKAISNKSNLLNYCTLTIIIIRKILRDWCKNKLFLEEEISIFELGKMYEEKITILENKKDKKIIHIYHKLINIKKRYFKNNIDELIRIYEKEYDILKEFNRQDELKEVIDELFILYLKKINKEQNTEGNNYVLNILKKLYIQDPSDIKKILLRTYCIEMKQ